MRTHPTSEARANEQGPLSFKTVNWNLRFFSADISNKFLISYILPKSSDWSLHACPSIDDRGNRRDGARLQRRFATCRQSLSQARGLSLRGSQARSDGASGQAIIQHEASRRIALTRSSAASQGAAHLPSKNQPQVNSHNSKHCFVCIRRRAQAARRNHA